MDMDHYAVVLGFSYGDEATQISKKDISKAYRLRALELHPDKRPNDPNAHVNFQRLKSSYEILMDDSTRKLYDDSVRVKRERDSHQQQHDAKRRKMMSDLVAREQKAMEDKKEEKERIARKLREEVRRIRARYVMHVQSNEAPLKKNMEGGGNTGLQGKVLKVKWEKVGVDYTAQRLRELFGEIGEVEDVMIRSYSIKRGSAIVVMASEDEALLACQIVFGDLSNPLSIKPIELSPRLSKLVGPGYMQGI